MKPDCLLAKVLLGKYCKATNFMAVQASSSCSHGRRSVLCGRDLLLEKTGKVIGNGADTRIWEEPWLSTSELAQPMGPPELATKNLTVADLIDQPSGTWNRELVSHIFPIEAPSILCLRPSTSGALDKHCWLPTKDGEYSTRTGYFTALEMKITSNLPHTTQTNVDWRKDIWTVPLPPKLRVFLWKITKGALPLGENLETRGLTENLTCTHCGMKETASHLFLHCQFAVDIWSAAPISNLAVITTALDFEEALKLGTKLTNLPPTGLHMGPLFPWIVWNIWITRNLKIFENRVFKPAETLSKAIADAREWQEAQPGRQTGPKPHLQASTLPLPRTDALIINTDASWKKELFSAGLAWVFSTPSGHVLHQQGLFEDCVNSAQMAEALAIREALRQAKAQGFNNVILKSDAQTLVRAINNRESIKDLFGILHDILKLACDLDVISFHYVPRSDNRAADELAKSALLNYSTYPL